MFKINNKDTRTINLVTLTHETFTTLKSNIETLAKDVKYALDVVLVPLLLTLNILHIFF